MASSKPIPKKTPNEWHLENPVEAIFQDIQEQEVKKKLLFPIGPGPKDKLNRKPKDKSVKYAKGGMVSKSKFSTKLPARQALKTLMTSKMTTQDYAKATPYSLKKGK